MSSKPNSLAERIRATLVKKGDHSPMHRGRVKHRRPMPSKARQAIFGFAQNDPSTGKISSDPRHGWVSAESNAVILVSIDKSDSDTVEMLSGNRLVVSADNEFGHLDLDNQISLVISNRLFTIKLKLVDPVLPPDSPGIQAESAIVQAPTGFHYLAADGAYSPEAAVVLLAVGRTDTVSIDMGGRNIILSVTAVPSRRTPSLALSCLGLKPGHGEERGANMHVSPRLVMTAPLASSLGEVSLYCGFVTGSGEPVGSVLHLGPLASLLTIAEPLHITARHLTAETNAHLILYLVRPVMLSEEDEEDDGGTVLATVLAFGYLLLHPLNGLILPQARRRVLVPLNEGSPSVLPRDPATGRVMWSPSPCIGGAVRGQTPVPTYMTTIPHDRHATMLRAAGATSRVIPEAIGIDYAVFGAPDHVSDGAVSGFLGLASMRRGSLSTSIPRGCLHSIAPLDAMKAREPLCSRVAWLLSNAKDDTAYNLALDLAEDLVGAFANDLLSAATLASATDSALGSLPEDTLQRVLQRIVARLGRCRRMPLDISERCALVTSLAHVVSAGIYSAMLASPEEPEYDSEDDVDGEDRGLSMEVIVPLVGLLWRKAAATALRVIRDTWNVVLSLDLESNESSALRVACLKAVSRLYAPSLLVLSSYEVSLYLGHMFAIQPDDPASRDMFCAVLPHVYSSGDKSTTTGDEDEFVVRVTLLPHAIKMISACLASAEYAPGRLLSSGCGKLITCLCIDFLAFVREATVLPDVFNTEPAEGGEEKVAKQMRRSLTQQLSTIVDPLLSALQREAVPFSADMALCLFALQPALVEEIEAMPVGKLGSSFTTARTCLLELALRMSAAAWGVANVSQGSLWDAAASTMQLLELMTGATGDEEARSLWTAGMNLLHHVLSVITYMNSVSVVERNTRWKAFVLVRLVLQGRCSRVAALDDEQRKALAKPGHDYAVTCADLLVPLLECWSALAVASGVSLADSLADSDTSVLFGGILACQLLEYYEHDGLASPASSAGKSLLLLSAVEVTMLTTVSRWKAEGNDHACALLVAFLDGALGEEAEANDPNAAKCARDLLSLLRMTVSCAHVSSTGDIRFSSSADSTANVLLRLERLWETAWVMRCLEPAKSLVVLDRITSIAASVNDLRTHLHARAARCEVMAVLAGTLDQNGKPMLARKTYIDAAKESADILSKAGEWDLAMAVCDVMANFQANHPEFESSMPGPSGVKKRRSSALLSNEQRDLFTLATSIRANSKRAQAALTKKLNDLWTAVAPYYAVHFSGEGFASLANQWFVYAISDREAGRLFAKKLQEQYPDASVLLPNVPFNPTIGMEQVIQLFPAYRLVPSVGSQASLASGSVVESSTKQLAVYVSTLDLPPVLSEGSEGEAMPMLQDCGSVGGTPIKRVVLDVVDLVGGPWCLVRKFASVSSNAVVAPALASLHWLSHHVTVLRQVLEASQDSKVVEMGGMAPLIAAALEEVLSPVLTAVMGPSVSAWLIRDIQEMREGYRRRMKTILKQEYIRSAKAAKEAGLPEPAVPDYDSVLGAPRDEMLDGLVHAHRQLEELADRVLEAFRQCAERDEDLVAEYQELQAMHSAALG